MPVPYLLKLGFCLVFMVGACTNKRPLAVDSAEPEAIAAAAALDTAFRAPTIRHVILITIDTLRADILGIHGGPAKTPHLDQLARSGWWFEQAISASMITNPSHASIMTSLYPRDHGVHDNESGIHEGLGTIAQALKRHGYATGAVIGFPHLNPTVSNLGQGFADILQATRTERRADETSQVALRMLDRLHNTERQQPVFMWVHYVDPHAPYEPPHSHPPKALAGPGTSLAQALKASPNFQKNNPWFKKIFADPSTTVESLVHRYIAEVEATDAGLGILLAGLQARGIAEQTAIVITSDHGENLGERELYFHHGGLYKETVHVPLIVAFAADVVQPARIGGLVETVDIAPTILELLDVPRWEPMRGRSLVGRVSGRSPARSIAVSEHMLQQLIAVRSASGTLIKHRKNTKQFPTYEFKAGHEEFYDLRHDPQERHSTSPHGALYDELSAALGKYLGAGLNLTARPAANQDRESLRALGYIE